MRGQNPGQNPGQNLVWGFGTFGLLVLLLALSGCASFDPFSDAIFDASTKEARP